MALESKSKYKNESNLKEEEDESVVDLEGELINALDELKMTWRKKNKIKEKLLWDEEGMKSLFTKVKSLRKLLRVKTIWHNN